MFPSYTESPDKIMYKPNNTLLSSIVIVAVLGFFAVILRAQTANPQSMQAQPQESRSVWDGIYTEKQAQRGEALFHKQCSSCHGDKLTGEADQEKDAAPALTGRAFQEGWNGRSLGDLFKKILRKMPQDDPGTLTPQQTADLVAFILSFNKFPAGEMELPAESEPWAAIRLDMKKPEPKSSGSQ